jgi:hypothetical protein
VSLNPTRARCTLIIIIRSCVICKNKLHVCKILCINKIISDLCFVIVLTVLKDSLHIYPRTFKTKSGLFLKVKILKPYCASTYSVWQYCIEIKSIKWKRILDHKHKLSIFSPKFDPCGPLFLKIKILKLYCALSTYSTVEFTSQLKCDRQTEGQGWKQYPVFFLKVRGYIWRLSFNTVKTITKHRSEIILLIHKILQTCSLFLQITHERMMHFF